MFPASVGWRAAQAAEPKRTERGPVRVCVLEMPQAAGVQPGVKDPSTRAAVNDLLTARLTGVQGVELVERAALDAIFRELGLTADSLGQASGVSRVGQLAKVDWFVIVAYPPGLTNAALGRVVDGTTGTVRELQVSTLDRVGPEGAVEALASMLERARAGGPEAGGGRIWIGLGAFEDLGLYPRYPDLGERLRTALALRSTTGQVSVVERRHVAPLVEEIRLGRLGLTTDRPGKARRGESVPGEQPAPAPAQAQPAFLLVDGIYQAYQDERSLVQLVLRLEWVGGRRSAVRIKAGPGMELEAKVVGAVEQFLAEPPLELTARPPTRTTEARIQMERAYDFLKMRPTGRAPFFRPPAGLVAWGMYPRDRGESVREAISAFESVLLLDPGNLEARFGRAGCWIDPVIDRVEDARDEWREIAVSTTNGLAAITARRALAESYMDRDDRTAFELLVGLRSSTTNLQELVSLNSQVQVALAGLLRRNLVTPQEQREAYAEIWHTEIRWAAEQLAQGRALDVFRVFTQPMGYFGSAFKGSNAVVERRAFVTSLVSNFLSEFPSFEWYLVPAYVSSGDAAPAWRTRHEQLLSICETDPSRVVSPTNYYTDVLRSDLQRWMRQGDLALADRAARIFEQGGKNHLNTRAARDEMDFLIGHVRFLLGRHDEAAAAFERIGSRQVALDESLGEQWGGGRFISGLRAAELCRQRAIVAAGGTPPERPRGPSPWRVYGSNELHLALAPELGAIWLHDRHRLHRVDLTSGEVTPVTAPIHPRVRQMVMHRGHLWLATGGGLYVWDPATGKVVTNSVEQGLLMPSVTALAPDGDRIWVGFGSSGTTSSTGGLGYWDLAANRFVGRMVELPDSVALEPGYKRMREAGLELAGMPRRYVLGLSLVPGGPLWISTPSRLLRHQPGAKPEWEQDATQFSGARLMEFAATPDWVAVATREPSGWNSEQTNFGGLFLLNVQQRTHRRLGVPEGLPNNDVTAVSLRDGRLLAGGIGFLAWLNPVSARVEKLRRIATQHPVSDLIVTGRDLWFTAGPGLYRVPADLNWSEPAPPPETSRSREITSLAAAQALVREREEVKRVYRTIDVPEYAALNEQHLAFVRRAALEFPVLTMPTRSGTNASWFQKRALNRAGRGYDGFRFRNTLNETADLGWIFAAEAAGSFARWWIYPVKGPSLKGFDSWYSPTMAYTNAPWDGHGSYSVTLQYLSSGQLMPGQDYILWFEFSDARPTLFQIGAELFPSRLKYRSRTILEGTFGLSGPPLRNP